MRKNTARHWLHAALDLLPVILIPVFMIYSHRHVLTERTEVDIQYKYQSNEVNTLDDLVVGNIYSLSYFDMNDFPQTISSTIQLEFLQGNILDYNASGVDEEYMYDLFNINLSYSILNYTGNQNLTIVFNYDEPYIVYTLSSLEVEDFVFRIVDGLNDFKNYSFNTIPQYTDYNVIESVDVQDTNSSIMNVFMDDFNYSVNKYFNMGNVFNLKDVYHWFEVNIFNNNPPVVMASIYNIIVYEFVMDLLFLLYGLFMWFVDMLKRLIEKPIDSIK